MTKEDILHHFQDINFYYNDCGMYDDLSRMLDELISENKGEWKMPIQDDGMSDPIYYQVRCSKCGFDLDPQTWHQELHQYGADNFCPNCGADMRGKAE